MAYEKQTWVNDETVIEAEKLDHIEDGIYDNDSSITEINEDLSDMDFYVTSQSALNNVITALGTTGQEAMLCITQAVSSILTNGAVSYMSYGIATKVTSTQIDVFMMSYGARTMFVARWGEDTLTATYVYQLGNTSISSIGNGTITGALSTLNTSLSDLEERVAALEQAAGIAGKESPQGTEPGPEEDPDPDDDGDGTAKEEPGIVIPDDGDPDEGEPDDDGGDDGDTKTAPGPEETGDGDEPDDGDDGDDGDDNTPAPDPEVLDDDE